MLPSSLLIELFDKQITCDEFEEMSRIPGIADSLWYNTTDENASIISNENDSIEILKIENQSNFSDDNSSTISTLSSPTSQSDESFWQDLEAHSSLTSSDEEYSHRAQYHSRYYATKTFLHYSKKTEKIKSYEVKKFCSFCFKNNEKEFVYTSHDLRDEAKNITCPALFNVICRFCGATGSNAHTPKFCSYNKRQ